MAPGILDTIGLAGSVALAIPVALLGLDLLVASRPSGAAFLGVAAAMVLLPRYLLAPGDLPGEFAGRLVGAIAKAPEEDE